MRTEPGGTASPSTPAIAGTIAVTVAKARNGEDGADAAVAAAAAGIFAPAPGAPPAIDTPAPAPMPLGVVSIAGAPRPAVDRVGAAVRARIEAGAPGRQLAAISTAALNAAPKARILKFQYQFTV